MAGPLLVAASCCYAAETSWPTVRPLRETFAVSDPARAVIKTTITDNAGGALYLFVCRAGNDESVPDVNYSGDLDCRLMDAALDERETNLLLETDAPNVAAWYSRGRMFARDLMGECAKYPEYGAVRHFRLRGMLLTMYFKSVHFIPAPSGASSDLASYTLALTVERDKRATRAIAESSGYLDPHVSRPGVSRSCSVIERGTEWNE